MISIACVGAGRAQEAKLPPDAENVAQSKLPADYEPWRFSFTPYAWAINVGGSITARQQTIDVNASFLDIVDKSNSLFGMMGYFEADKGWAGFYGDFVYASLGFGASKLGYRNLLPHLTLTVQANAALTYQMFIAEMGGIFELHKWQDSEGSFTAIDALGGFRLWDNTVEAGFDVSGALDFSRIHLERFDRVFNIAYVRQDDVHWVDPLIGLRLRHQFTPHQEVFLRGDVGGFGLGSQFSWQAVAAYSYQWQADGWAIAAVAGFRALSINYYQDAGLDSFGLNLTLYGPIIGASFRF